MTGEVRILYASATGTAEDFAEDLRERLALHGGSACAAECSAADAYDLRRLPADAARGTLFLFVVSTCGDGAHPRHLGALWAVLRRADLPHSLLRGMRFAVFGLGDRAYVKFNAAARRLFARLVQLGASAVVALADSLGDEGHADGFDPAFSRWTDRVCRVACPSFTPDGAVSGLPTVPAVGAAPQEAQIEYALEQDGDGHHDHDQKQTQRSNEHVWTAGQALQGTVDATLVSNCVMTRQEEMRDEREVRSIVVDVTHCAASSGLRHYVPGDVLHVVPRNRESAVNAFLQLTGLDGGLMVRHVTGLRTALNLRMPCSVRALASAQLDLWATPRRRFFARLAPHATHAAQRLKLEELGSPEGADALVVYALREKRTVLMVLRDFPSARPPLPALLDIVPRIRPRAFSIASARDDHDDTQYEAQAQAEDENENEKRCVHVELCVAVVRYSTPLRFVREGLCSGFLSRSRSGDCVPVWLERASALSFRAAMPALLVCSGTGVAPMRAFVAGCSRRWSRMPVRTADGGAVGVVQLLQRVVVLGCRSATGDCLYGEELAGWQAGGVIDELALAVSRGQEQGMAKMYVQDRLRAMGAKVWRLVSGRGAYVYVAGAAGGMPKGVRQALVDICDEFGDGAQTGQQYVRRMELQGRLQFECW